MPRPKSTSKSARVKQKQRERSREKEKCNTSSISNTTPAPSLRPVWDVFSRMQHDIAITPFTDEMSVGYLDRFSGMLQVPFTTFLSHDDYTDIPMHRIYHIYFLDLVVWDRDKKHDIIFGSGHPCKLAMPPPLPYMENNRPHSRYITSWQDVVDNVEYLRERWLKQQQIEQDAIMAHSQAEYKSEQGYSHQSHKYSLPLTSNTTVSTTSYHDDSFPLDDDTDPFMAEYIYPDESLPFSYVPFCAQLYRVEEEKEKEREEQEAEVAALASNAPPLPARRDERRMRRRRHSVQQEGDASVDMECDSDCNSVDTDGTATSTPASSLPSPCASIDPLIPSDSAFKFTLPITSTRVLCNIAEVQKQLSLRHTDFAATMTPPQQLSLTLLLFRTQTECRQSTLQTALLNCTNVINDTLTHYQLDLIGLDTFDQKKLYVGFSHASQQQLLILYSALSQYMQSHGFHTSSLSDIQRKSTRKQRRANASWIPHVTIAKIGKWSEMQQARRAMQREAQQFTTVSHASHATDITDDDTPSLKPRINKHREVVHDDEQHSCSYSIKQRRNSSPPGKRTPSARKQHYQRIHHLRMDRRRWRSKHDFGREDDDDAQMELERMLEQYEHEEDEDDSQQSDEEDSTEAVSESEDGDSVDEGVTVDSSHHRLRKGPLRSFPHSLYRDWDKFKFGQQSLLAEEGRPVTIEVNGMVDQQPVASITLCSHR